MPGFDTLAIHAGQPPDPATGSVVPAIHLATTFAQSAVGEHKGFEYSRTGNPTRTALEACVAALEGAAYGRAFASGLAAEDAVLRTLAAGDHLVVGDNLYGGTHRLLAQVHTQLAASSAPLADLAAVEAAWRPTTRLVWVETPSNPHLWIAGTTEPVTGSHGCPAWIASVSNPGMVRTARSTSRGPSG